MRRDMDLVRAILKEMSESTGSLDANALTDGSNDFATVAYHVEIMIDAGLIRGNVQKAMGGNPIYASIDSITWEGNDFLDAVANDGVWSKVKKSIAKTIGSASFDMTKALAVKIGTEMLLG